MKVIKGILEEELENSIKQEALYIKAISELPRGVIVKKQIKRHEYYYLLLRDKGKVKFIYKGKLSETELKQYEYAKKMRAKYRKLLKSTRTQISFLRKVLNAREIRTSF